MSLNNQVFLHGRLARDPELRQTKTDKAVCRFTVATDEGKTQSGEKITEFHNVTAWNRWAEFVAKRFKKGDPILIWGHNHTSSYEKDGHKVYTTSVEVERAGFPLGKPKGETYGTEKTTADAFEEFDDDDAELPF